MISRPSSNLFKRPASWWTGVFMLIAAITFPSIAIFKKPGVVFLAAYLSASITCLVLYFVFIHHRAVRSLTEVHGHLLFAATLVTLIAAHFIIYPAIDVDGFKLMGIRFGASDSDNAIEDCLRALIRGSYPYYETTFLGNPMTPMPGALLLAAPFYFLHHAALQNFFWLLVFYGVLSRCLKPPATGALVIVMGLVMSPNIVYHLMHGGDYISNGIYVLVAMLYAYYAMSANRTHVVLSAIFLGVAMSSRLNYVVCLPIVFAAMIRTGGWMRATIAMGGAGLVTAMLTLPFYLYDPAGFSPLHTTTIASRKTVLPYASMLLPLAGLLLSFALAARRDRGGFDAVCRKIYILQLMLLLLAMTGVMFADLSSNDFLQFPHFSMLFAFFGLYGFSGLLAGHLSSKT